MLIWSGRGILIIVVFFISFISLSEIFSKEAENYCFVTSMYITGVFSYFFGKKWNVKNERILLDEETGERVKLKNNHSLFWIPMQYWGYIFVILGTIMFVRYLLIDFKIL